MWRGHRGRMGCPTISPARPLADSKFSRPRPTCDHHVDTHVTDYRCRTSRELVVALVDEGGQLCFLDASCEAPTDGGSD